MKYLCPILATLCFIVSLACIYHEVDKDLHTSRVDLRIGMMAYDFVRDAITVIAA